MHDKPIPGQTNDVQDQAAEAATLGRVLWLHPTHLTEAELLLNLFADDGPRRERFERAIRDLVAHSLLRIDGEPIMPTLTAVGAVAIVCAFGLALSWIFAFVALTVRGAEAAQSAGFVVIPPRLRQFSIRPRIEHAGLTTGLRQC